MNGEDIMNGLSVSELNDWLDNIYIEGKTNVTDLPGYHKSGLCSLEIRNFVRRRYINATYNEKDRLTKDNCAEASLFIRATNIPKEEKEILSKYLDDSAKKQILTDFINSDAKSKYFVPDQEDCLGRLHAIPKEYGVPLRKYFIDERTLETSSRFYEMGFQDFVDFLTLHAENKPSKSVDTVDNVVTASYILKDDFFSGTWIPSNVTRFRNALFEATKDYVQNVCKTDNAVIKKSVADATIQHTYHASDSLSHSILESIPSEFNQTEKAIYIYAKLCKTLSYDPIYYYNGNLLTHTNVSKIEGYNDMNNEVVCYEFSYILADLLKQTGIEHIKEGEIVEGNFKNEHANVLFESDDLIIRADSTRTVLGGDMSESKYKNSLAGIRCELYDEEAQQRFKNYKNKVRTYLNEEDKKFASMFPDQEVKLKLENDRLIMFNNYLEKSDLKNADLVSYAMKLKDALDLGIGMSVYFDEETKSKMLLNVRFYACDQQKMSNIRYYSYFMNTVDKQIYFNENDFILSDNLSSAKKK